VKIHCAALFDKGYSRASVTFGVPQTSVLLYAKKNPNQKLSISLGPKLTTFSTP